MVQDQIPPIPLFMTLLKECVHLHKQTAYVTFNDFQICNWANFFYHVMHLLAVTFVIPGWKVKAILGAYATAAHPISPLSGLSLPGLPGTHLLTIPKWRVNSWVNHAPTMRPGFKPRHIHIIRNANHCTTYSRMWVFLAFVIYSI